MADRTAHLQIEFDKDDKGVPWMYPLALNGREIKTLTIDGEQWIPAQNITDIRDAELMQNIRRHIAQLSDDYEQLWTRYKAVVHENTLISKQQDYARRMRAFEADTEVHNL